MSSPTKKPGFSNAAGSRNRRVNRFAGNLNRTDRRHKEANGITIASVAPDQFTDSGNDLAKFESGEFVDAEGFIAQDGTYEIDTAVAGQIDVIEQTVTAEGAGPDVRIKSRNNRIESRLT